MRLHEVYAICNICIFGNITRGMLRRFLFLHIVSLSRFDGHSSTYGVIYHCFYLCILQRIWRGRLPDAGFISGALTTLVIPSRDCPRLVAIELLDPENGGLAVGTASLSGHEAEI